MTDPVVSMEPATVAVEPGGQARVEITIANQSSIVEGYRITVVDDREARGAEAGPADWVEILPPDASASDEGADVSVYPQQRQSVMLIFSPPPGGETLGGSWAFAVRVASVVNEDASVVTEGDLELGRVLSTQGKLTPVTSSGRWRGLHVVQLTNWGNTGRQLRLSAEDPDQALGFLIRPDVVQVPVGATVTARIKVRTRTPRLRGTVTRLPFTVIGEEDSGRADVDGDDGGAPPTRPPPLGMQGMPPGLAQSIAGERVAVDGAFTQRPILTKALVTALVLLLAGVIALVAYAWSQRADVETYESLGTPPTPVLMAQTTGADSILLSWAPVPQVEKYRLDQLQGNSDTAVSNETLEATLGAHPVEGLDSDTEVCFTLTAIRGDRVSPSSEKACSTTEAEEGEDSAATVSPSSEAAPTDPEPTGGDDPSGSGGDQAGETVVPTDTPTVPPTSSSEPTPTVPQTPTDTAGGPEPGAGAQGIAPGEWVAQLGIRPVGSFGEDGADLLISTLEADGVEAEKLLSSDYPTINPPIAETSWIVYRDEDYTTREAAMDGCREVRDDSDAVGFCDPPVQPMGP
ncbi:MAG: fibronectin type III domain-containing protein [Ornithinimicrobium sp.]